MSGHEPHSKCLNEQNAYWTKTQCLRQRAKYNVYHRAPQMRHFSLKCSETTAMLYKKVRKTFIPATYTDTNLPSKDILKQRILETSIQARLIT